MADAVPGGGRLLISFCNLAARPLPSCLLAFDPTTRRGDWVDVGLGGEPLASGVGLTADEDFVYHLTVRNADFATFLVVLSRRDLAVAGVQELPAVADAHSIVRLGDELVVVSTDTDEILAYHLDGAGVSPDPRLIWTPSGAKVDTEHVNSVALVGGQLLCTAFGPKPEASWASAANGYIYNLTSGETLRSGLRHPHTVADRFGQLLFCNSQIGTIEGLDGPVAHLSGYSRGLAFATDGTVYAGTSLGRRPIDDPLRSDVFGNPDAPGVLHGRCAVVRISPGGSRTEIGLSSYALEVYDLLLV